MARNDKYIKTGVAVVFGIIVWCFWALGFPHALGFQEQLQCFLFDGEYFAERISMPGGFARYVGEFFVQMFYKPFLGATVIAISFVLLQLATWFLARKNGSRSLLAYILTFIPVLLLWWCIGDVQVKFTFVIALLLAEVAMMLTHLVKKIWKLVYLLLMTPLLAWLAGPVVLFFALYVAVRDNLRKPFDYISLAMLIYAPACIIVCGRISILPLSQLFYGQTAMEFNYMQYIIMAAIALLPLLLRYLPEPKTQKNMMMIVCGTSIGMVVIAGVFLNKRFNTPEYDVIKYDYLVRGQKWDKIINISEKKTPNTPLTVASLNLALAIRGQLNERASEFYQNGWQGAFPPFTKDFEVSIMTSEIYFYLGLVNTAQRLNFEAMEALPDYNKSARLIKRLAETNLINGQYIVARKYLTVLQKTLLYSRWATRTMALIGDEKAIDAHPLYGHLREIHLKNDFMFSEEEIDKVMGHLLMDNPKNTLAMQYLLFLPQLENNPQKYQMYSNFVRSLYNKE